MEIEVYSRSPDPAPPAPKFYVRVNGKVVVVTEDAEVARVMGAAFDLLAACRTVIDTGGDTEDMGHAEALDLICDIRRVARAAISKAVPGRPA